jgi:hypothetical protein
MNTQYQWKIAQLERQVIDGFVFSIQYSVLATDETDSAVHYGYVTLNRHSDELIPYESLTEDLCLYWVKTQLGDPEVTKIEADLQQKLEYQKTPAVKAEVPWTTLTLHDES